MEEKLDILKDKNRKDQGVGIKTFDVPIGEGSICKSKSLKERCTSTGF